MVVFLAHRDKVIFVALNSVFMATIKEARDKIASTFKIFIAKGPLL